MSNSLAKKVFAVGSTVAMVFSVFPVTPAFAAPHSAGTNIKSSDGTVWMIMPDNTRRPYTSAGAFLSYGFNSWSSVVDANADDLALPAGAFIPPQDGKVFCASETKGSDVKGECSLITGGQKAAFTSEAVFKGLGFSFTRAAYGDSSFLTKTSNIASATEAHRPGVLVNNNGTVQLVGTNGLLGIPDLTTFNSWGYSFADVVPANSADKMMTQTGVMAARTAGQLSPTAVTGGTTPNPTGTPSGALTVSYAASNPASGTHASGTAYNPVLTVNMTASSAGSVTVNSLTLTRGGIAIDSNISGVAAFDAAGKRLNTNFVSFADSKALISFSPALSIAAGSTVPVTFKTNTTSGSLSGTYTVGINSASDINASSTASGVFPLVSNVFNLVTGTNVVGSATVDMVQVVNNATVNLGTIGQELAKFRFVAGSSEDIHIHRLMLYNNGNANDGDVTNIKLMAPDGTTLATVAQTSNRYITFDMSSNPYKIMKGNTRDLSVRFDVVSGSTRTVRFVLQNDYDVEVMGAATGSGLLVTAAGSVDTGFPIGDVSNLNLMTINSGSILFSKATTSPTGNLSVGANSVTMGEWEATAQGEDMELRQVAYSITTSTANVTSVLSGTVRLKVNDSTVLSFSPSGASPQSSTGTALSSYPIIKAGQKAKITFEGDVLSTAASGSTVLFNLDITQVKRISSNDIVDPSVSAQNGNTLGVTTATFQVSKNTSFGDTTVVSGLANAKVGSFNLTASSTEDVSVSSMTIGLTNTTNISNLLVKDNMGTTDMADDVQLGSVTVSPAASNVVGMQLVVPKGQTKTVDVYVTTNGSTTGTEVASITAVSATGKDSSNTITATGVTATGQTTTFTTSGALTVALDTTNTAEKAILHSSEVDRTLLAVRLTSSNAEDIKVTTMQVTATNGASSLQNVKLTKSNGDVVATTQLVNGAALFNNASGLITVSKDSTLTVYVKASTNASSVLNSQAVANLSVDYIEAVGVSGGTKIKPGTTLNTAWSATSTTVTGASITVADTTGFHKGDVVFAYDGTNGGSLGMVTVEPSSTTAMTVATTTAITYAGSATISKIASGAYTPASAGTALKAGAALTVTATKAFQVGDPVIVVDSAGTQLGFVSAIGSATSMTVKTIADMAGTAAHVAKLGTDTVYTTVASGNFTQAPLAMTVASSSGFSAGDLVLVHDGTNNGSFGMVTAIGSSTSMTIGTNAAVTNAGNATVVRVGGTNASTVLVTTAASAGNRVIAATATTVTDTTGFGAGDVTLSIAATGGAILGKVGAVSSTTSLTIASAAASGTTTTRLTRLPGAQAASRGFLFHDVEPVITVSTTAADYGQSSFTTSTSTDQIVGIFKIKADGDRNLGFSSIAFDKSGSNSSERYVTSLSLYNGATQIAKVANTTVGGVGDGANANADASVVLCTGADPAAGEIGGITAAEAASILAGDRITVAETAGGSASTTATVSTKTGSLSTCGGASTLTLTFDSTVTITGAMTAVEFRNFRVHFDANQAQTNDQALAAQTVTAGDTMVLTVKADTSAARTGLSSGTATFALTLPGTSGPFATNGMLTWNYTPSGGSAVTGLTVSDNYPVNGPTFTY